MQLSSVIGKPILSPCGVPYGYVTNARLARGYGKIACFVCADADEEEFYLPARAVRSLGDAVIAGKARLSAPTGLPTPIGLAAYSDKGESLGCAADLLLSDGMEGVLVLEKEGVRITVPAANAYIGQTIIVYPDRRARTGAHPSQKRTRTPSKRPMSEVNTPPMSDGTNVDGAPMSEGSSASAAPMSEGGRKTAPVNLGRCDLLGRQVKRTVYDRYGNIIATAGERITPALLSRARRANKLLELTVKTISNI